MITAIYINTCLVVAVVRWFHMCHPYDRKPRYYYPSRPYLAGVWLTALLLLPYLLNPLDADAWFLARLYFLPVTLYHFTLLLTSYFGTVMGIRKWRLAMLLAGLPVLSALLVAVVLAIVPGDQTVKPLSAVILYVIGGLVTALCLVSMSVVYVWSRRFDLEEFSNPKDFPVRQARHWLVIVFLNMALCWTGVVPDNPLALAAVQLVLAVVCVLFLISALHPNRIHPFEEPSGQKEASTQVYHRTISKQKQAEILAAIRTVVEEREGFLDSHLTLQDVADSCGYGRTYISGLVKSELGGFATYINRLRLAYVEAYLKQHPGATLREAIEEAGFGSRSRYYDAKSKSLQNL